MEAALGSAGELHYAEQHTGQEEDRRRTEGEDGAERGETTTAVTLREVQPGSSETSTCQRCSFHTGRLESI